jgi:uncharacterized protein YjgD (DUF1641 family)
MTLRSRTAPILALVLASSLGLRALPAGADDDHQQAREQLMREIDDLLRDMKDRLDRVPGSSGTGEIDDAVSKAQEVKSRADRMRDVKDDDSDANTVASYYGDWVDRFREAAGYLEQMKAAAVLQNDQRLWEKCQESDRKLRDQIDRYLDKNDPRGLTEIPKLADDAARELESPLRALDETDRNMGGWKDYAKNFSASHRGWGDVTSELRDGADKTFEQWKQRMHAIHERCDDLARGKQHPYVVKALEKLADSDKARDLLYQKMDQMLEQAASLLADLPGRSGTSELDSALGLGDQLLSALDTLRSARGEDEKAKKLTDVWPDKVAQYKRSLEALKQAKALQNILDRAPERCQNEERELKSLTDKYLASPDDAEEGVKVITDKAIELGQQYRGRLEAAEQKRNELERYKDDALGFDYDEGKWRPVKERIAEGANGVYRYYTDKLQLAKKECQNLALGDKHPLVLETLKKLGDSRSEAQKTYERVQSDYEQWKKDRRGLRPKGQFRMEEVDKIRLAICDEDDWQLDDRVKAAADRAASDFKDRKQVLLDRLQKLIDDLKKVETSKDTALKENVQRLLKNMRAAYKRLETAGAETILKGANNPMIRTYMEVGKRKHDELTTGCTANEYPVGGGRIDCLNIDDGHCDVIEIKPNNADAVKKGWEQIDKYRQAIEEMFKSGTLKELLKRCVDDGKLNVDYQVKTYEFCPSPEELDVSDEPEDE